VERASKSSDWLSAACSHFLTVTSVRLD